MATVVQSYRRTERFPLRAEARIKSIECPPDNLADVRAPFRCSTLSADPSLAEIYIDISFPNQSGDRLVASMPGATYQHMFVSVDAIIQA